MHTRHTFSVILLAALALNVPTAQADKPTFSYSGFVRVIAGYLDDDSMHYDGYGDQISFGEHSLLGLQGELEFTEKLSITAQLLAHSSNSRDSGVEWFYLSYKPTDSLRFKLGKLRTPIFDLSDTVDIGFAYPYILPPQQVYAAEVVGATEGLDISYSFSGEKWRASIELYAGRYDGDINTPPNGSSKGGATPVKFRDLMGVVGKFGIGNLDLRAARYEAQINIQHPLLKTFVSVLDAQGFPLSAASIDANQPTNFLQLGAQYENLDYFLRVEYVEVESKSIFISDVDSYYASAGYYFSPFTLYGTYANAKSANTLPQEEIQRGVSATQDLIADGYQSVFDALGSGETDSYSVGVRWDVRPTVAIKAELSLLRGQPSGSRRLDDTGDGGFSGNQNVFIFDSHANFYAVGVEWVF